MRSSFITLMFETSFDVKYFEHLEKGKSLYLIAEVMVHIDWLPVLFFLLWKPSTCGGELDNNLACVKYYLYETFANNRSFSSMWLGWKTLVQCLGKRKHFLFCWRDTIQVWPKSDFLAVKKTYPTAWSVSVINNC